MKKFSAFTMTTISLLLLGAALVAGEAVAQQ